MTLAAAAQLLHAPLLGQDRGFTSVSTDTRSLQPGALFVALQGPSFDGHRFVETAREKGAVGALVSEIVETTLPVIRVQDTRRSLGELASGWRQQHPVPVVGVTGSNGKTTVKEMIAAILREKSDVLATRGNLNNDIGMPLTLLGLREERFVVLEMGANHPGEIAYLTRIARPDVAVITNAGAAHLEGFGDLYGVARAKGEILDGLPSKGVAVLNADDPRLPIWLEMRSSGPMLTFGFSPDAEVHADPSDVTTHWTQTGFHSRFRVKSPAGEFSVELALAGEHNLRNALAAIAACQALGVDTPAIQRGLVSLQPVPGRLMCHITASGLRVIDDSYNANPDSMAAAVQVLRSAPGRRLLVMGDLAELGEAATALHYQVGQDAKTAGIDALWSCGELSRAATDGFGEQGRSFPELQSLIDELQRTLVAGDTVLIKGSRSARMERVVNALVHLGED